MADAPLVLPLSECHDNSLAGGKAINLGHLINAGFPVPDGFVVTTAAFRKARGNGDEVPQDVAQAVITAYRQIGSPTVAVRSSATAEDMAGASMAGQYETFLDIRGEQDVLSAVRRCWQSVDSPRTRTYLAEHGIDISAVAMAVVVQELVPSDVAGVLFTANPQTGSRSEMLIEASWGLGESVVSGIVQPDTVLLDRATAAVKSYRCGDKHVMVAPGLHEQQAVAQERRTAPCLNSRNVHELYHLGLKVMDHFGSAQDIEWAIHSGNLYLLQSRAITTLEDAEAYENCLQQTRARLRQARSENRGEWVRHNISETLPHPTPLTWSAIRRFMSGDGGFGGMYKAVGFEPSETVGKEGFLDLIAGRIYMDLSRGGDMFFEGFPFKYDLDLLRTNPDAAQGPPTVPAGSLLTRMGIGRKLAAINAKIERLAQDYDRELDQNVIPQFVDYVRREKQRDLKSLGSQELLELWQQREKAVLDEFAPKSLLPSLMFALAGEQLRTFLDEHFWDKDPAELVNLLAAGAKPDLTIDANDKLYLVAQGQFTLEQWLAENGHRAPEEFDLATPRWRERPEAVSAIAAHLADATRPKQMHDSRAQAAADCVKELENRLGRKHLDEFRRRLDLVRRYMRFREDGKYYLMLGYDLLRDVAMESGRRLDVGEDVFLLNFEELRDALTLGIAPLHLMEQRRISRAAEAKVPLDHVITEGDIEQLGTPKVLQAEGRTTAFPISPGSCAGPAKIVFSPQEAGDLGKNYVLVCPSTDPSWTPLFVNAVGLVLECGGTLSHGAVVAREMGIPAVVLPDATELFKDGESISVDGHNGAVIRGDAGPIEAQPEIDPDNTRIGRHMVPPVAGPKDRAAANVRNFFLALWGVYLAAAFILPAEWLYNPSLKVLDAILWPLVASLGKPATVAVVAAVLAAFTMIAQRFMTDNRRLTVAKNRADALRKQAAKLPKDAPRRKVMLSLAGPVQTRVMLAAFVPLAVILGPMVMSFMWFPLRVDPASWNAPSGTSVNVSVFLDGAYLGEKDRFKPVTLELGDSRLTLADNTPATQSPVNERLVLKKLLKQWQDASDTSSLPWEMRAAVTQARSEMLASLDAYIKGKMPSKELKWTVHTAQAGPGRFPITIKASNEEPITTYLVLGNAAPPEPKEDLGDNKPLQIVRPTGADSKIEMVKVVYLEDRKEGDRVFWKPFAFVKWKWDAGWLVTYILAYVPLMFLLRFGLRLP